MESQTGDEESFPTEHNASMQQSGQTSGTLTAPKTDVSHTVTPPDTAAGNQLFPCDQCPATFSKSRSLKQHVYVKHVIDKNHFPCTVCNLVFKKEGWLQRHIRVSHRTTLDNGVLRIEDKSQNLFPCAQCKASFKTSSSLKKHMVKHKDTGGQLFYCDQCSASFQTMSSLKRHMIKHDDRRPFRCNLCERSFISKGFLAYHMRLHSRGEKPFLCSFCAASFAQQDSLNVHLRTHTGERPYVCSICGAAHGSRGNLRSHMATHATEKTLFCEDCGASFKHYRSWTRHKLGHLSKKPYPCKLCDASFKDAKRLQIHMQTHTGVKPHTCSECGISYHWPETLKKHYLKKHGMDIRCGKGTQQQQEGISLVKKVVSSEDKLTADISTGNHNTHDITAVSSTSHHSDHNTQSSSPLKFRCTDVMENDCDASKSATDNLSQATVVKSMVGCYSTASQHDVTCNAASPKDDDGPFCRPAVKGYVNHQSDAIVGNTAHSIHSMLNKTQVESACITNNYLSVKDSKGDSHYEQSVDDVHRVSPLDIGTQNVKAAYDSPQFVTCTDVHAESLTACTEHQESFTSGGNNADTPSTDSSHSMALYNQSNTIDPVSRSRHFLMPVVCQPLSPGDVNRCIATSELNKLQPSGITHTNYKNQCQEGMLDDHNQADVSSIGKRFNHTPSGEGVSSQKNVTGNNVDQMSASEAVEKPVTEPRVLRKTKESDAENSKLFPCLYCGAGYPSAESLKQHSLEHNTKGPFACGVCGVTFKSRGWLQRHVRVCRHRSKLDSGIKSLVDSNDSTTSFADKNDLPSYLRHDKMVGSDHSGTADQDKLSCDTDPSTSIVDSETLSNATTKPLSCFQCGKSFNSLTSLKKHMVKHKDTSGQLFLCDQCPASYTTSRSLQKHMIKHNEKRPFPCHECGRSFISKGFLAYHLRIHKRGDKPYLCSYCAASFSQQDSLNVHMRTHTGEKPYVCTVCGAAHGSRGNLRSHMATHTTEKTFYCQDCGASFKHYRSWTRHKLGHLSKKPYPCDLCEASFKDAKRLQIHMQTHTGVKPHTCSECGISYHWPVTLKRHKLRKHGIAT